MIEIVTPWLIYICFQRIRNYWIDSKLKVGDPVGNFAVGDFVADFFKAILFFIFFTLVATIRR